MSLARARGAVIDGIEAHIIEVEAHISSGLPYMAIVGLGDTAVNEARDRVRAAILNSGARWPDGRITVGLSPAWLHKRGSGLDLAIATAILAADGQLPAGRVVQPVQFAELGLDGRARPVAGAVVAAVTVVRELGRNPSDAQPRLAVALRSAAEAALIPGLSVSGITHLAEWMHQLSGCWPAGWDPQTVVEPIAGGQEPLAAGLGGVPDAVDLADVHGQPEAVAALELAAAGGHHLSMVGRPGVGKTMLAERLPTLLPDLDDADALTVTAIRSVLGGLPTGLIRRPPFQAPHHTATMPALVGGGAGGQARPGQITLAHAGVLFLDEAPEFPSACLEALRQPLESGRVCISRSGFTTSLPARFQMVLAANPCPCGNAMGNGRDCRCSSVDRRRYSRRLSGPLLDRVDIHLQVHAPQIDQWSKTPTTTSAIARERVRQARERAAARAAAHGMPSPHNSAIPGRLLRRELAPEPAAANLLGDSVRRGALSARAADRAIRVAWTISDCAGAGRPGLAEVGRALSLRGDAVAA